MTSLSLREKAKLSALEDLEPTICEAHNASLVLQNFFVHNVTRDKNAPHEAIQLSNVEGKCLQFLIADIEDRVNKIREQFYEAWHTPGEDAPAEDKTD